MTDALPATPAEFAAGFRALLDETAAAGRTVSFWWRDDDAVEPTPALERLIGIAERHGVPLALAVIPAGATEALGARVGRARNTFAIQHGWSHTNHQAAGSRAAELGDARPADAVLAELAAGRERLEALFPRRFLPVLTPPWNRIAPAVAERRHEAGLPGLSAFGALDGAPARIDTHIDPIAWRIDRGYIGDAKALAIAREQIAARRDSAAPIGLLTHHLAHDDAVWAFVEAFVAVAASHPAARWPDLPALFGA